MIETIVSIIVIYSVFAWIDHEISPPTGGIIRRWWLCPACIFQYLTDKEFREEIK